MGADLVSELYIRHSHNVAYRRLGEGIIVLTASDPTLFDLNEVAAVIWESADGHTPLSEIVQRHVCEKFDVGPADALRDAEEFVNKLAQHGVLLVSDRPTKPDTHAGEALP